MSETAWKTFELKKNYLLPLSKNLFKDKGFESSTLPRQALPKTYTGQGYVDIVKLEVIKKGQTYGPKTYGFVSKDVGEIDTKDDLEKIRNDKKYKKLKIFKFLKSLKRNNIKV